LSPFSLVVLYSRHFLGPEDGGTNVAGGGAVPAAQMQQQQQLMYELFLMPFVCVCLAVLISLAAFAAFATHLSLAALLLLTACCS
jgi:hypothetical protein